MVLNLRKQIAEESIHVKFHKDSFYKDYVHHSQSILDELISFPSPKFLDVEAPDAFILFDH